MEHLATGDDQGGGQPHPAAQELPESLDTVTSGGGAGEAVTGEVINSDIDHRAEVAEWPAGDGEAGFDVNATSEEVGFGDMARNGEPRAGVNISGSPSGTEGRAYAATAARLHAAIHSQVSASLEPSTASGSPGSGVAPSDSAEEVPRL